MPKQTVSINFSQGLDNKNDPYQVSLGNFLSLSNSVFTIGKRLTKRNGFGSLTSLPSPSTFLTTFNGDLTAVGSQIEAYSTSNNDWVSKGQIKPLTLNTITSIRNNLNQIQSDAVIAPNGLVCTVYTEINNTTKAYKYVVSDSITGQNIIAPTALNASATNGTPKVYLTSTYFIIIYDFYTGSADNLKYIAIPLSNPANPIAPATISTSFTPSSSVAFDAYTFNDTVYVAWNGAASSGIKMAYIGPTMPGSSSPVSATVIVDAAHSATVISVTADVGMSTIWTSYYDSGASTGYTLAVGPNLAILANFPAQIISTGTILNITSAAQNGINQIFWEVSHTASGIQTNFVASKKVTQSTGAVASQVIILRSVGLASKAFIIDGIVYVLCAYSSQFQPTYFLVNGTLSTSASPVIVAKLAYENGGGYLTFGLPAALVSGSSVSISYLYKDLIQALSNADAAGLSVTGGVYSQTGINLVTFTLGSQGLVATEIGANLNISGGYLIAYDGYSLAEQNFHLWPDSVQLTPSTSGGFMTAQKYYYQVTYEWTDNQGNAFRSAGSIPVSVTTTGSTSSVTLTIPTLRITQKIANPVKVVIYRWSTAQEVFYQVTSIIAPVLNDTTADTVTFLDTQVDTAILGNNILYTTGGVVEDTGAPATSIITLFDDRLWLVDSEDQNLMWYSKQVIEATPVEMSDLFTIYVNPNVGSTGPTGPITALSTMDDKLVIFKKNALNYINGSGPDNTGANSQFSQPTFITSMVGCGNQNSIVFQPGGLMFEFESEAGNQIWMLGRNLDSQYIGAPVEALTKNATVLSAISVPGTNQVRFNLSSGITLMYDYFYGQWGTFSTNAISSTLYQDLHTYIDSLGRVFQETPDKYLDGTVPVVISFTTSWINLAALQGFERFYYFYFLGTYLSPHLLDIKLAYNYVDSTVQSTVVIPDNFSSSVPSAFGDQPAPFGSPTNIEQWKIHALIQKCQSFQISITEIFDPSLGVVPGAGLSLSGLNIVASIKRGSRPIRASNTAGN